MAPPGQRKIAFSTKQKKEQLKEKRERKKNEIKDEFGIVDHRANKKHRSTGKNNRDGSVKKINEQPSFQRNSKNYDPNRYRLHFRSDTNEDVERGKTLSRHPITMLNEEASEIDLDDIYRPGTVLDMPKRPAWDYNLSREVVEANEEKYFKNYLDDIFENQQIDKMSYFELNLETWRQLWRVLEMSDVILLITDIRHPALHFSPALYNYVVNELNKHIILILNKIDLAPPSLVVAWKHYFLKKFPDLHIVCFTSMPKDDQDRKTLNEVPGHVTLQKKRRRRNHTAVGPKQLLQVCEQVVSGKVDLSSWKDKIEFDASPGDDDDDEDEEEADDSDKDSDDKDNDDNDDDDKSDYGKYQFCKDNILTIGCCGYPNVGKSSVINGLVGKKVVSVSRTPGHTKHFQTIFLTKYVKLCDSPGLVFPSLICKPLQILAGIYPISQLREPYTTIRYLAERLPLPQILKLKHPDSKSRSDDGGKHPWSAYLICDAWAEERGFLTAHAARNDVYRAANHLLRMACEGRLCLCMRPPLYSKNKEEWCTHPETEEILKLQEMHKGVADFKDENKYEDEEDEDDVDNDDDNDDEKNYESSNPYSILAED